MNVILLMSDSLTPHLSGPYGDTAGSTPNLDGLASRGVVFENAYCNSPLCVPSRASMVTGRYASDLNCYDNASDFPSEWPTIGHALGSIGYETVIIGKMHFVGHDQFHGFDERLALETDYTNVYDPSGYLLAYDWEQPSGGNPAGPDWMGPSYVRSEEWDHYPKHYDWDERIHGDAISYLSGKEPGCEPFFACISYHQPHNPFWIPEEIREKFQRKDLPLPEVPTGVDTCHGPMDRWLNDFHYLPRVREAMMEEDNLRWLYETYYGMTYDMDRRIGEVLDLVQKRGLAEDTAVVFASDHGDMLGHRGMLQKRYFYERSVRSCLIFSYPGNWPSGARVGTPVSLIDLFPTLADLAGAPVPDDLPGVSLLSSVRTGGEPPKRPILCEYHGEGVHAPCFMSVLDGFKYILVPGHEERLYNLEEDPDEYHNLIGTGEHQEMVSMLKDAILDEFDPDLVADRALTSQRNRGFIFKCARSENEE